MAGFGKWLGGGLGFILGGGPIGAIIGFALGSMFDAPTVAKSSESRAATAQNDFKMSLLVLIACVMKADGRIQKSELAVAKRFLVANFGEEGALEALQILKNILEQDVDASQVAMQINQFMNYSAKLQLIHLLFDIALADGEVHPSEQAMIESIATIFRISHPDFESLKAPYFKNTDPGWAYKTLEIESTATEDEIKKAYRRMAMKFHPDKVNNLGDDLKKSATEKFRSINEAYETIKKTRGMS
ncbi:MAG: TerB family tellurite resistance protein [Paludibacter sp.]